MVGVLGGFGQVDSRPGGFGIGDKLLLQLGMIFAHNILHRCDLRAHRLKVVIGKGVATRDQVGITKRV